MKLFGGRRLPDAVRVLLDDGELVLAHSVTTDGADVVATRLRLLSLAADRQPAQWVWSMVAKATLQSGVLTIIPLAEAGRLSGADLVIDQPPVMMRFDKPAKLTDQVHHRVRRSVAASRHLPWPGAGGWVSLRRVAGRDGLTAQVRLDPGADPAAPGFADALAQTVAALRSSVSPGTVGADDEQP